MQLSTRQQAIQIQTQTKIQKNTNKKTNTNTKTNTNVAPNSRPSDAAVHSPASHTWGKYINTQTHIHKYGENTQIQIK